MLIADCLSRATLVLADAQVELPERTARWLWQHVSGMSTADLLIRGQEPVDEVLCGQFSALIARRAEREPLQYLLGEAEFDGLAFAVDARVLIPRPETEQMVALAMSEVLKREPAAGVVQICDVGTGSGAIAVSLAVRLRQIAFGPAWRITATDLSLEALVVAKANARRHGVADLIEWVHADLLESCETGRPAQASIDLLLANLPYIPEGERLFLQPEVGRWEPSTALFAGADGLDAYRRLLGQAGVLMAGGGRMLLEIGVNQSEVLRPIIAAWWPGCSVAIVPDAQGIERVVDVHVPAQDIPAQNIPDQHIPVQHIRAESVPVQHIPLENV